MGRLGLANRVRRQRVERTVNRERITKKGFWATPRVHCY